jgi:hypothetical protein
MRKPTILISVAYRSDANRGRSVSFTIRCSHSVRRYLIVVRLACQKHSRLVVMAWGVAKIVTSVGGIDVPGYTLSEKQQVASP